jgi:hypothetical protein
VGLFPFFTSYDGYDGRMSVNSKHSGGLEFLILPKSKLLFFGSGVRISLHGTSATVWLIVPAPDDG